MIKGREVECVVFGNEIFEVIEVGEIVIFEEYFFDVKYEDFDMVKLLIFMEVRLEELLCF